MKGKDEELIRIRESAASSLDASSTTETATSSSTGTSRSIAVGALSAIRATAGVGGADMRRRLQEQLAQVSKERDVIRNIDV